MATTVVAIAAVASVVVSGGSMTRGGGSPDMGSAPAPANYYQYDEDGNLTSAQTWNADKHAFESKENPEPSKEAVRERQMQLSNEVLYKRVEQGPEYQALLKDWEAKHGEWKKGVDARKED